MFFYVLLCRRNALLPSSLLLRAPPKVNYLGTHLSKLLPLICGEQCSSAWDLTNSCNGASWAPSLEDKQRDDTQHQKPALTAEDAVSTQCGSHMSMVSCSHCTHLRNTCYAFIFCRLPMHKIKEGSWVFYFYVNCSMATKRYCKLNDVICGQVLTGNWAAKKDHHKAIFCT